jgi:hypothetical protein
MCRRMTRCGIYPVEHGLDQRVIETTFLSDAVQLGPAYVSQHTPQTVRGNVLEQHERTMTTSIAGLQRLTVGGLETSLAPPGNIMQGH